MGVARYRETCRHVEWVSEDMKSGVWQYSGWGHVEWVWLGIQRHVEWVSEDIKSGVWQYSGWGHVEWVWLGTYYSTVGGDM